MKNIITNDIVKMVQAECFRDPNITPFVVNNMSVIRIGRIRVVPRCVNDKIAPLLMLDEDVDSTYNQSWKADIGSILLNELKRGGENLYELKSPHFTALLKEIEDSEIERFLSDGFVHLKICDKAYTILKVIKSGETYQSKEMYGDYEVGVHVEDEIIIAKEPVKVKKVECVPSYELF